MINFLEINTFPGTETSVKNNGIKTGGSGKNDLFASMLESIGNNTGEKSFFSGLYSDKNSGSTNGPGVINGKPVNKSITDKLQNKKINPDEMIVPAELQNHLFAFLEKQGFSLKDISQVISASKNSEGLIELGKLFKGLSTIAGDNSGILNLSSFKQGFSGYLNEQGIDINNYGSFLAGIKNDSFTFGQKEASFIESSSVPGTGEVLFKLGLGAEDVKKALEKSMNGKGEIETGRLTGEVNRFLTNTVSESDLISRLSENNISVTKRMFNKPDEKTALNNMSAYSSELRMGVINKELKQNIDELLRETGVSEEKISSVMTKLDSALVRFSIDQQHTNGTASGTRKSVNISVNDNQNILGAKENSAKMDIFAMLKENGVSEEKISSVIQKLDAAFTGLAMNQQQTKEGIAGAQNSITMMGEDKRIISNMLGENQGQDVSSFLKNRGVPEKDIKNMLDSFRVNYKNAELNQNDNLRSALLNDRVSGTSKNDSFVSSENQGNLKLNINELLKTAEKRSDTDLNKKSSEGSDQSGATFKAALSGKDKGTFSIKESVDQASINILQDRDIKNIGKIIQADSSLNLTQQLPKIVDKMLIMFRAGEYQSRLQISPPELGRLDIDLTIKNGRVHANLSAESSAVKEIIEANLSQLKQQLNSQGLTIDKFNVMVSPDSGERKDNSTWTNEKDNKGSGRGAGYRNESSREIIATAPLTRAVSNDNQIDVHV